jgi:hypothetical protein
MLDKFINWARQVSVTALEKSIEIQITESVWSDNPSARLDIDTPMTVARITFWESGDYDTVVIRLETGENLFSSHGNLESELEFSKRFMDFFKSIGIIATEIPK